MGHDFTEIETRWQSYPDVPGAFWPCASNSDWSRAWVERVDFPEDGTEPFANDDEAAWAVAQATGWPLRYAHFRGAGGWLLGPYVQPFDHDDHDPQEGTYPYPFGTTD